MSERRGVTGKQALYIYLTKSVYKGVRLEALKQGTTVSKLIEACLALQMVSPPLIGTKLEKAGKPRKNPRVPFVPINAHAYPKEEDEPTE